MADKQTIKIGDPVREIGALYNLQSGIVKGFNRAGQVFVDWYVMDDAVRVWIHDSVRFPEQLEVRESF